MRNHDHQVESNDRKTIKPKEDHRLTLSPWQHLQLSYAGFEYKTVTSQTTQSPQQVLQTLKSAPSQL